MKALAVFIALFSTTISHAERADLEASQDLAGPSVIDDLKSKLPVRQMDGHRLGHETQYCQITIIHGSDAVVVINTVDETPTSCVLKRSDQYLIRYQNETRTEYYGAQCAVKLGKYDNSVVVFNDDKTDRVCIPNL